MQEYYWQGFRDKMAELDKSAVMTGGLGYLTAPAVSIPRAAEVRGALRARDQKPEHFSVKRPYLSALLSPAAGLAGGAAVGGIAGALTGGSGRSAGAGAALGGFAGASVAPLVHAVIQQARINKAMRKLKEEDPEAYARLKGK